MRALRVITAALFCMSGAASAETETLTPLLDAMQAHADRSYIYARCAALHGAGLQVMTDMQGPPASSDLDLFLEAIGFHLALAHLEAGHDATEMPTVDPAIQQMTSVLQDRYEAQMKENYLASGNVMVGFVDQDRQVCAALKEATIE